MVHTLLLLQPPVCLFARSEAHASVGVATASREFLQKSQVLKVIFCIDIMMQCVVVLRIFILITVFMNAAEGIKCFQCNSQRDPGCAELGFLYGASRPDSPVGLNVSSEALKYYRECEDNYGNRKPFCRKMFQTIFARDKLEVVTRSCGWELHPRLECYEFENKGHAETVCQCFEDGCNHAPLPRPLVTLTVLVMTLTTFL